MEDYLPNMTITRSRFRVAVNDQYMMLVASNTFGPNPPARATLMEQAIDAVVFQYSIGAGVIDRKLEQLGENEGEAI